MNKDGLIFYYFISLSSFNFLFTKRLLTPMDFEVYDSMLHYSRQYILEEAYLVNVSEEIPCYFWYMYCI